MIPDSVTSIGASVFYNCSGLQCIVTPDSVEVIGDEAFSGCSGLTSVVIGDGVTSIGYRAFYNCSGLQEVYYKGNETMWSHISIGYNNDFLQNATRYYYSETKLTEEGSF